MDKTLIMYMDSIHKKRVADPIKNEIRMSCLNAASMIEYFSRIRKVPIENLIKDLSINIEFLNDAGNWLNNIDTYRIYYNCHHSIPGLTHKNWTDVGGDIYRNNASRSFKTMLRLLSLNQIYKRVPRFNRRLSRWSKYTIIDFKKNYIRYKYEIADEKIRKLYSIGCECNWHIGILSSIPKINNPKDTSSIVEHEICGMNIHNILENCYHISPPQYQYKDEGLYLDGSLAAKWIKLKKDIKFPKFLSNQFEDTDQANANALVLVKDIILNGVSIFRKEEIYNAPYCIFVVNYKELSPLKRFFIRKSVSADDFEEQIRLTENKFYEANALRHKEKLARLDLKKSHSKLKEYADRLEEMVEKRTAVLVETQAKLIQSEKRALEHRITGGFAHEMRNALAGAQLEFRSVHNYQDKGKSSSELLKDATKMLLKNLSEIHHEFNIPREKIAKQFIPELKIITGLADHLSAVHSGISRDLDRGLSITNQIREYARMSELKPGSTPVDVVCMLKDYKHQYRQEFEKYNIKYSLDGLDKAIVKADKLHLNSIFSNLILNAKDALAEFDTDQEKEISVFIYQKDERIIIKVQDNGPGIKKEHLQEIFEPFYSTKPTSGTGLGLGIVQRLIQLYDGSIVAESNLEKGSQFLIYLKKYIHE